MPDLFAALARKRLDREQLKDKVRLVLAEKENEVTKAWAEKENEVTKGSGGERERGDKGSGGERERGDKGSGGEGDCFSGEGDRSSRAESHYLAVPGEDDGSPEINK